jgi:hypothetical protein
MSRTSPAGQGWLACLEELLVQFRSWPSESQNQKTLEEQFTPPQS